MTNDPPSNNGLSIFAPTADQRYLLGADLFLRTHFPMSLRQYHSNTSMCSIGEDDLLGWLLEGSDIAPGNRLWIVYGAPGSGKSELMKWLETRIRQEDATRAATMVRISRTDLDVLSIAERFRMLLPPSFFRESTYNRWQMAYQKPRTLAKLILLFALENLLDSDEVINALFYRLLNVIQPHIERVVAARGEERGSRSIELMSMEAWETIVEETAIPVAIEYEQFRHQMTVAFNHHLLEGLSLPDTLRRISSEVIQSSGTRPLLLIDDLVQSLNIFASDLIDYFITLEEGNWDVVIGLTPAAFEASQRGRLLLQRIAYLDTIDDRVEKLWLSDEAGYDSYVLTEENCHDFAARYLVEYQSLSRLEGLSPLHPFNRESLMRIYRGLPTGKGKARYFLRQLRSILEEVARGEPLLPTVAKFAHTESVARCEDKYLASICELYGPLVLDDATQEVTLSGELLHSFGREDDAAVVPVEPLLKTHLRREAITEVLDDEEKAAVRDWLLGREVNRQLLHSLRQGAARLLRATFSPTIISYPGVAHPHGILNWQKPYLDVHPPIRLEGVDECDGILLSREIGQVAFDLHRYAHALGVEAKQLESLLLHEARLLPFFFDAQDYWEKATILLETQLGTSLERLALSLYLWGLATSIRQLDGVAPLPVHITDEVTLHSRRSSVSPHTRKETYQKEWVQFFEDFFKLRENLYDGPRLATLCSGRSIGDIMRDILTIDTTKVGKEYRWGKRLLYNVLAEWQEEMRRELTSDAHTALSWELQEWVNRLQKVGGEGLSLAEVPLEVIAALVHNNTDFTTRLKVYLIT